MITILLATEGDISLLSSGQAFGTEMMVNGIVQTYASSILDPKMNVLERFLIAFSAAT